MFSPFPLKNKQTKLIFIMNKNIHVFSSPAEDRVVRCFGSTTRCQCSTQKMKQGDFFPQFFIYLIIQNTQLYLPILVFLVHWCSVTVITQV